MGPLFGVDLGMTDERVAELERPVSDEQFAWLAARGRLDNLKTFAENRREAAAAWTRIPGPLPGKCGVEYRHSSGWSAIHCGHPTAIFPFYLRQPDGGGVYSCNGRAFKSAAVAKGVIERILSGELVVSGGLANSNALGERVQM